MLGLDVGERHIGVALSDSLGLTAQRLTSLHRQSGSTDVAMVCRLISQHQVEKLVIGLPLTLKGGKSLQTKRVESFAAAIRQRVSVPVEFVDERLTTVQGERALREAGTSRQKRKALIDQVAAQLILQHYLDRTRAIPS